MQRENRKIYLDVIRILAMLLVIYNHVAGRDMRLFSGVGGAAAQFLLYVSKSAIPLFLMVSGAAMLDREEPYQKFFKRIGRIAAVLLLISLFYYGAGCIENHAPFKPLEFLDMLYHYQASNSLWYLYAYIGLLVMLPLLQRMTASFGRNEYLYFAFWTLLFNGLMPILQHFSALFIPDSSFVLPVFTGLIGMAVLGRGMDAYARVSAGRTAAAILFPLVTIAAITFATMRDNAMFNLFDNAFLLPAMGVAVCIAYLVKRILGDCRASARVSGRISHVARLVFCTYLFADFAIEKLEFVREALVPALQVNGAGVVYVLLVFVVCMLLAECLTRIPGLRRLL